MIKLIVAGVIVVAALVGLVRFHRYLRGESGGLLSDSKTREPRADATELEAFVATYRRDKAAGDRAVSPARDAVGERGAGPAGRPSARAAAATDRSPR